MLNKILHQIQLTTQNILGSKLTGIYLHGSIAFGCFNWEKSDIDYIVVVGEHLTLQEKVEYIKAIYELNKIAPPKGIEMSIVLKDDCRDFVHPSPFELHFSSGHLSKVEKDITEYCSTMNGADPDLAAHFTVINHVGQVLFGKPVSEVFAPVPKKDYLDSIKSDIENAAEDIYDNPVYIILNLCRVLAYINDGLVLSKQQGGEWEMNFLPEKYKTLVFDANLSYTTNIPFSIDKHHDFLPEFTKYMTDMIFTDNTRKKE